VPGAIGSVASEDAFATFPKSGAEIGVGFSFAKKAHAGRVFEVCRAGRICGLGDDVLTDLKGIEVKF
jgi:hypothetical protein